jgi:hypothetical protein
MADIVWISKFEKASAIVLREIDQTQKLKNSESRQIRKFAKLEKSESRKVKKSEFHDATRDSMASTMVCHSMATLTPPPP